VLVLGFEVYFLELGKIVEEVMENKGNKRKQKHKCDAFNLVVSYFFLV